MKTKIKKSVEQEKPLEMMVTDIIQQLGIPANIKGYRYLRYALILCVENNEMITSFTKLLYPAVAEKFGTNPSSVSSCISRAVKVIWDKGNEEALRLYFGNAFSRKRGKPTNAEFIADLFEMLRLKIKLQNQNKRQNFDETFCGL